MAWKLQEQDKRGRRWRDIPGQYETKIDALEAWRALLLRTQDWTNIRMVRAD